MFPDLTEIANQYGTDKGRHGYMPHYARHLIDFYPKTMLEIGCEKGNSARMWREILPKTELAVLDLFQEYPIPDIENVEFIKGNQLDHELLYNLRNNRRFDIIIDDGSHNSRDQWVTFWSLVGSGRLYVVEDLHCCYDELYRQGLPFARTMLGQMLAGHFPYRFQLYDQKIAFIYVD